MNIRKHTYYRPSCARLIFYQSGDGSNVYTRYMQNPAHIYTLSNNDLHLKSKNTLARFFRVYNNFYIRLAVLSGDTSYHVI